MKIRDEQGYLYDFYELPVEWQRVMRAMYRALRIRVPVYASTYEANPAARYEGMFYGKDRAGAKAHLIAFLEDLNWLIYLGSK